MRAGLMTLLLRNIRALILCAAALLALPCLASAARYDIAVFDFDNSKNGTPDWIGICLADYAAGAINSSKSKRAAPRQEILMQLEQMGLKAAGRVAFEQKESIASNISADAILEGRFSLDRNSFDFKGTLIDPQKGTVKDISFKVKDFTIQKAQNEMIAKLAAALGDKLAPKRDTLQGTSSAQAYTKYWQAVFAYDTGLADKALGILSGAISDDKDFMRARLLQARITLEKTQFTTAIGQLEQCLKIAPGSAEANYLLGLAYFLSHKNTEAKSYLKAAADKAPGNAEYLFQLGVLYKSTFQTDKAVEHFERAVKHSPGMAQAWYELAAIYAVARNNSKALDCLENVLRFGRKKFLNRVKNDADFDSLRTETRYREAIRKAQQ